MHWEVDRLICSDYTIERFPGGFWKVTHHGGNICFAKSLKEAKAAAEKHYWLGRPNAPTGKDQPSNIPDQDAKRDNLALFERGMKLLEAPESM